MKLDIATTICGVIMVGLWLLMKGDDAAHAMVGLCGGFCLARGASRLISRKMVE